MTRTGFAAVVVLVTAVTAASTREPTFSRVETYPDMGRLDYILAGAFGCAPGRRFGTGSRRGAMRRLGVLEHDTGL